MPRQGVIYGIGRDVTERAALTDQQAALRRVATLVARQALPEDVLAAVAEEMAQLLGVATTSLWRFEDGDSVTLAAQWGEFHARAPVGRRFSLRGDTVTGRVARTGRPARIDRYTGATGEIGAAFEGLGVRSGVGAPIVVDGRLWGSIGAAATEPLPPDAESRIVEFTDLVASWCSRTSSRSRTPST
jgi:GAF domain-containing protein